jgi:hypothetical protein
MPQTVLLRTRNLEPGMSANLKTSLGTPAKRCVGVGQGQSLHQCQHRWESKPHMTAHPCATQTLHLFSPNGGECSRDGGVVPCVRHQAPCGPVGVAAQLQPGPHYVKGNKQDGGAELRNATSQKVHPGVVLGRNQGASLVYPIEHRYIHDINERRRDAKCPLCRDVDRG